MCVSTHTHKHREQILAYLGDFYECVFMLFTYAPFWTYIYSSILNTFCQELFRKCKGLDGSISLYLSGALRSEKSRFLQLNSSVVSNKPSAVRTYAMKSVSVPFRYNGWASIPKGFRVNRAVTPTDDEPMNFGKSGRRNGWSSVRCRCGQTIKSKSISTRRATIVINHGAAIEPPRTVPCFI